MTPYHARHWAEQLTLQGNAASPARLSRSIADARVDLNPHQVDAALFALRSPLSKGVVLADEVGLGKTVEAGLVMAQRWAEGRRRMLVIVPAPLRTQWLAELTEKFHLPARVLDAPTCGALRRQGVAEPLQQPGTVLIASYQFIAARAARVKRVDWDLVVLDEAHRLRNVYKRGNKLARAVREATGHARKLLLTATPLQNSLMELYGLVSFIDDTVFGSEATFRTRFLRGGNGEGAGAALRERLRPLAVRTLRRQVEEYVPFTRRISLTQEYTPSDAEQRLYDAVSAYLQQEAPLALPAAQRHLMTLVARKLLASSPHAIAGTLESFIQRLREDGPDHPARDLEVDYEGLRELADEWGEEPPAPPPGDPGQRQREVQQLRACLAQARAIGEDAKGRALLAALTTAFARTEALGAPRKAVIFTESRRTQAYLRRLLEGNGYRGEVVLLNGGNDDPESRALCAAWQRRHQDDGLASGARGVDTRSAIVESFRQERTLLIATEAAAEGVNLQFCSLVINYDLPWNPQRVEQRIGRCHRYGQKHDVVVVNFVNRRNAADRRVYQLLKEKFRLFDGVFGASDEVLGALESGVDIEKRIATVYQECRTAAEIETAFDQLQQEMEVLIQHRMAATRQAVLEHFDEEVQERLAVHRDVAQEGLDRFQRLLYRLTRFEIGYAEAFFHDDWEPRFHYDGPLAPPGWYNFRWRDAEALGDVFYRPGHPLARAFIQRARARELPEAVLALSLEEGINIAALAPYRGRQGWLEVVKLSVTGAELEEELLHCAVDETGAPLPAEAAAKLLRLPGRVAGLHGVGPEAPHRHTLAAHAREVVEAALARVDARHARLLEEESAKLERWADDLKTGLERELMELDRTLVEARRGVRGALGLAEQLAAQRRLREQEKRRDQKRRALYDAQDAIDARRDALIAGLEQRLQRHHATTTLFRVWWTIT